MRKIALCILTFYFFLTGCSALRKSAGDVRIDRVASDMITSDEIITNNISNEGFNIIKADIDLETDGINQKFMASVKFISGEYLISLRSRTGIEAARIYMDSDTLLVNDRINKILYYGKPGYLRKISGYPGKLLPLIFGDYLSTEATIDSLKCYENRAEVIKVFEGLKMSYIVDCKTGKIVEVRQEGSYQGIENVIKLDDFYSGDNKIYARNINIEDRRSSTKINIRIDKAEIPWNGLIDFVPGINYEKVELK